MEYLDVDTMVTGFRPEEDLPLPSGAGRVRIRGVSRKVAVKMAPLEDANVLDAMALEHGMVKPQMDAEQAQQWCDNGLAADVQAVVKRISELSSLDDNAPKEPTSSSRRTRR
jgi:hypothetical protein